MKKETVKYENTFENGIKNYWLRYAEFEGRSTRMEFWSAWLIWSLLVGSIVDLIPGINVLWWLANIVPGFCLTARRFHDTNRSAWNMLWILLPIVGWIILLVLYCLPSDPKANKFGKARI